MPAELPPFMNAYGNIERILDKIKVAETPPRFTQDFLGTKLGFTGGSATPFIPFAKRIGLVASDGTPTDIYRRFRNPAESRRAMAEAIRKGYSALYSRNEYAHDLDKQGLTGLIAEATGLETSSTSLRAIVGSFTALKKYASFSEAPASEGQEAASRKEGNQNDIRRKDEADALKLSYTITLNLPNTNDVSVFDAIFKSLREHLL